MTHKKIECHIPYEDMRGWIEEADKLGELRIIKGASWERDIGMASEYLMRIGEAPVALFEEIPGVAPDFRVVAHLFSGKRQNMTFGFPENLTKIELSNAMLNTHLRDRKIIPHKVVDYGPVFENVMMGDDVDLLKFPVPVWHEDDGGRYVGTGTYNVTRDPDEDWINVGTYRVMVHDKKSVGFYISPGKHGRIHRDKYMDRNEPMPVVIVVGGDPLTFYMACTEAPYGVCEFDLVGGLRGKPLEVVKGKITGLPFPKNAEIVLEGYVQPGNVKAEGPFGEWTGYYGSDVREEPVMDIKAIYHRNKPILFGAPPNCPPDEQARYRAVLRSAMIQDEMTKAGVPDVKAVWAHEAGGSRMLLGVSITQRYAGHARQAGHIACQCHVGAYAGKYVIVVDDDIDVSNLEELMWAMSTRSDPAESIDIIKNAWSTPLDPRIHPKDRAEGNYTNSRAIIDACKPFHWKDQFPKANLPSPEYWQEAIDRFSYLLK